MKPTAARANRWSQERRLEFVDFRLRWDGRLNRSDLIEFFGISVPQASLDIARYIELAPANLEYDKSARVYVAGKHFKPLFETNTPDRFFGELLAGATGAQSLLGEAAPADLVPIPGHLAKPQVLVALQRAIHDGCGLSVEYQSAVEGKQRREISPHVFVYDGQRWHVRAYCHLHEEFRTFGVARVLRADGRVECGKAASEDAAWHTRVKLILIPHPSLPEAHRRAVELDYGMVGGQAVLECRLAMVSYVLRRLNLESDASGAEEQQIVVLKNLREVSRLSVSSAARKKRSAAGTR